jgi:hypothetical protein
VRADFPVVLDACVLILMPLADTLLRLVSDPRLYLPKWTDHIRAAGLRLATALPLTAERAVPGMGFERGNEGSKTGSEQGA